MFKFLFMICVLLYSPTCIHAQLQKEDWRRAYTAADSIIEVDAASLNLDPDQTLRARFKTVLSKVESLPAKPEIKYETRLETIDFKLALRQYRLRNIRLLDARGTTVWSDELNEPQEWRTFKEGGMMSRLFNAASQLSPFGAWKVIDYRMGEGGQLDPKELRRLTETRVHVSSDSILVGNKNCSRPLYHSKTVSDKEFSQLLGISTASVGIKEKSAETIVVKCESKEWHQGQSLLVKLPKNELLMLWEGVLLVLKRR